MSHRDASSRSIATRCMPSTDIRRRSEPATCCSSPAKSEVATTAPWSRCARIRSGAPSPNLTAVLAAAGCTLDDVVDVTTFHSDPTVQFDTVMAVRAQEIGAPPYPNWTAVGATWLAGFDFEIKVIARTPQP